MDYPNAQPFGVLPNGESVELLTLRCGRLSCELLTYGGALRSLTVPDRDGRPVDVLLGLERLEMEVHMENHAARKCYQKAGFVMEGVKRHAFFTDGRFCDVAFSAYSGTNTRPAHDTARR